MFGNMIGSPYIVGPRHYQWVLQASRVLASWEGGGHRLRGGPAALQTVESDGNWKPHATWTLFSPEGTLASNKFQNSFAKFSV